MPADLHLHTLHSDGNWSPSEVVHKAIEQGLKCIAITDHDTTAGIKAARAASKNIEVIDGIEINTIYQAADGEKSDVHILGYFIDPESQVLLKLLERQQAARHQLVEDTIDKCRFLGINLTMDLVFQCSGKGSIGRPHLAKAIVKAGGARNAEEAFKRFMNRASADYVARDSVSAQEAIEAIAKAGGISSIAHPSKSPGIEETILELKKAGLHAIEAYHRGHSLNLVKHYLRLAATSGLLVTGGSDCHGPADNYPPSIGTVKVPIDVVDRLKAAVSSGGALTGKD